MRSGSADLRVICTHLACADEPDNDATQKQLQAFRECTAGLGIPLSIANSAGILNWPDSHADWNRPGYMLYGASPFAVDVANAANLRPAMSFFSEIIAIRDVPKGESVGYGARWTAQRNSRVATIAAGYADGYFRATSSNDGTRGADVIIGGKRCPIAGRVSMDLIAADITDLPPKSVRRGHWATLLGEGITVDELAHHFGTIGYEVLTSLGRRYARVYKGGPTTADPTQSPPAA